MAVDPKNLDRLRIQQEGAIAETHQRLQQLWVYYCAGDGSYQRFEHSEDVCMLREFTQAEVKMALTWP